MTHTARLESESNIYHITVRGVGKQILFEDDCDRRYLVNGLADRREEFHVKVLAWCLMDNHVHLLLEGSLPQISRLMQKWETAYAMHYNKRHDRVGTLFQGRFGSKPISSDEQLVAATCYIHRNPLERGVSMNNTWSSYRTYAYGHDDGLTSTALLLDVFGGTEELVRVHLAGCQDAYEAPLPKSRIPDDDALIIARSIVTPTGLYELKMLPKGVRNSLLKELSLAGLSIRQIARLTGIGKSIVERAADSKM